MPLASLLLAALAVSPAASRRAVELARRSLREYNIGEFKQALEDVQKAYVLDPVPMLLFNAGKCEQALEHWKLAERFYRKYLEGAPAGANRAEAQKLVEQMVAAQKPATARPAVVAPAVALPARAVPAPGSGSMRAAPNGRARARAASTSREREEAPSSRGPRDVRRETASVARARGSRLAASSPAGAEHAPHPAPAAAVTASAPRRGHALAWGLGATAVACAAVAVAGGLELSSYDAQVGRLSTPPGYTQYQQAKTGRGGAQAWQIAAIAAAALAVASAAGLVITW